MPDVTMQDAEAVEEERIQYGEAEMQADLDKKYPNRPHNSHKTLPFHELFTTLFNPLNENRKKAPGPVVARRKQGPHGRANQTPHEAKRSIIDRFISRWRQQVGPDIYPAFRLIIPEKDRDRAMYGMKEKTIGKLLVRVLGINKTSEDAHALMNWRVPGGNASKTAGDFALRCYEVISKRPIRTQVGSMTIAQVNEMLDRLSFVSKEDEQYPIFQHFYLAMNPEEMMWLIRIILRQLKVGATERSFFDAWHPDAEILFAVSSSLRRVCWELYDPALRLEGEHCDIALMQCFQPQLAAFQIHSFEKIVEKMKPTPQEPDFWIEEKLDGERMQLHMITDPSVPGGKRFGFWSRKAKDYTYLYGSHFEDENSASTRHLKSAFEPGVRNIILDGEMITWDVETDTIVPFGTLKTAALAEQRNPYAGGQRPVYVVFDCLLLNDTPIAAYTLRDRRRALASAVNPVHRRLEIHPYTVARSAGEIDPLLRKVVAEASEGLVIKNPRSSYRLNERNDDWIKVKPEYMTEFGESLDLVIIGGYYGSGSRGGFHSSYLCGLRLDNPDKDTQFCYSFCKVGAGMSVADYTEIRHRTDGKWQPWDPKRPPSTYIELGGGQKQFERPDEWIKPADSLVVCIKAASVITTDQFPMGLTLRFPRFKRLRLDKDWSTALSVIEFTKLQASAEAEKKEKQFEVDNERRQRRQVRSRKKPLVVVGGDERVQTPYGAPASKIFDGLTFFVLTDAAKPIKKTKAQLEALIKSHGGTIVQTQNTTPDVICIGERKTVKVSSIIAAGKHNVVRPAWVEHCVAQHEATTGLPSFLLPLEPRHMLHVARDGDVIEGAVDEWGDSYYRDVEGAELGEIIDGMPDDPGAMGDAEVVAEQLREHGIDLYDAPGWLFRGYVVYFDRPEEDVLTPEGLAYLLTRNIVAFAGGRVEDELGEDVTHVMCAKTTRVKELRKQISGRARVPHIVSPAWIEESWKESTLLDEERFGV
ncbi:DNA ligase [Trichodelitschia bisporula]|uniref:DNA ligase n=1 Tax=Trichodelitschia bisporula TaxID=703511 RepID=A0A6G1HQ76_9PEZI|nr:DNA ligase [Trichodelitschia bisporula]